MAKAKVEHVSREIIESKLLVALTDEDKVGVILSRDDLDDLIVLVGNGYSATRRQREMIEDLHKLRRSAFKGATDA